MGALIGGCAALAAIAVDSAESSPATAQVAQNLVLGYRRRRWADRLLSACGCRLRRNARRRAVPKVALTASIELTLGLVIESQRPKKK